ncbi:hypothetical protein [Gemmata sp.]|uniref:hypothetical protein n=1 Tax=Gemmata sp. TaxID=1914242 RepID=UPI003F708CA0
MNEITGACHPWSGALVTGGTDGKVRFWDIPATLKDDKRARIDRHRAGLVDRPSDVLDAHTGSVRALRFTPDGLALVTTGDDKCVIIWQPRP